MVLKDNSLGSYRFYIDFFTFLLLLRFYQNMQGVKPLLTPLLVQYAREIKNQFQLGFRFAKSDGVSYHTALTNKSVRFLLFLFHNLV